MRDIDDNEGEVCQPNYHPAAQIFTLSPIQVKGKPEPRMGEDDTAMEYDIEKIFKHL